MGNFKSARDGKRPDEPDPLSEDDRETEYGEARPNSGRMDEEDIRTDYGKGYRSGSGIDDGDKTEIGGGYRQHETEFDIEDDSVIGILCVKDGKRRGRTFKIKDGIKIGREDGDIVLDDPKVSNPHVKFRLEDEQYVIWDFGTKQGTFVNGEQIRCATPLEENDIIKICETTFEWKVLK